MLMSPGPLRQLTSCRIIGDPFVNEIRCPLELVEPLVALMEHARELEALLTTPAFQAHPLYPKQVRTDPEEE